MKPVLNKDLYPIFREAKCVNTEDEKKLGRIQVKVYPELADIPDADCPWAFPLGAGVDGKDFSLPQKDSTIYVIVFNQYWSEIAFISETISLPAGHLFDDWMSNHKSAITDMVGDPEEPNFCVKEYLDGFSEFHDTKNNQHGILHPSGVYEMVDKDGKVFFQFIENFSFHDKSDQGKVNISFDSDGNATETLEGKKATEVKGAISITGKDAVNVKSTGATTLTSSDAVNVSADKAISIQSTGSEKISIGNAAKVPVPVSTTSLGGMISFLISQLASLKTVGSPASHTADPGFITNMHNLKTEWDAVFQ